MPAADSDIYKISPTTSESKSNILNNNISFSDMISNDSSDSSPETLKDTVSTSFSFANDRPSVLVIILTILSSISGFMFGYDTGYISSALVAIGEDFGHPLSYGQEQFITAATSLGALIFSIISGLFVDFVGRKPVLMFSTIMFVVGAIIQCAAQNVWTMIGGRFVMGFGVGIGSLIAPLYISEMAPSRFRGRLVILNSLGCTGGQLVAYAVGAGLSHVNNGWRILVGLSMIPPTLQFVAFLFLPDTPRYLIMNDKFDAAEAVLKKTHPNVSEASIKAKIIQMKQQQLEDDADINIKDSKNPFKKWWRCVVELHTVGPYFRALFLACALQAIQQMTGFNSLMYFSATIFKAIGFDNATAVSLIVAGTNFLFTIIAFFTIDKFGRRRMLLFSLPLVVGFLVLNAIAFHFINIKFNDNSAVVQGNHHAWGIVIIVAMILYTASYAIGIGNVPWQQSELFPQKVRGVGTAYATATNWSGSLIISSTFLTMLKNITPTGTFSLFAGFGFLSFLLVLFCYPELSNLELEDVQDVLTGGFHIKKSLLMAKARKNGTVMTIKDSDISVDQDSTASIA